MKKINKLFWMCLAIGLAIAITGCSSMTSEIMEQYMDASRRELNFNSQYFNYLVTNRIEQTTFSSETLDQEAPREESATLRIQNVKITAINGIPINWQKKTSANPNNRGILYRIPAGNHTFSLESIRVLPPRRADIIITTHPIKEPITINFIAGHTYLLTGGGGDENDIFLDGIGISDVTMTPMYIWFDNVRRAPERIRTATPLEGTWAGIEYDNLLTIRGNQLEATFEQPTATPFTGAWQSGNNGGFRFDGRQWIPIPHSEPQISIKGTFIINDNSMTLYIVESKLNNKWNNVSFSRMAMIFNYRMEGEDLILAGARPETRYTRK